MELGKKWQVKIGDKEITVQTDKYCMLANGFCLVSCGDTVVKVTATMAESPREGIDFFPLNVDFEEKMYAVGKIPGGFKKREGRASDKGILSSRLIDRPLRPLFPKGFYNDVAIVATALSVDPEIAPEPLAMLGSSIALSVSDIPFGGPTGSVCVGCIDGKYVVNPTNSELERSTMHVMVSGTKEAILMVEAGANQVTEEEMLDAIMFGHEYIKELVSFQEEIVKELNPKVNDKIEYQVVPEEMKKQVREYCYDRFVEIYKEFDKIARQDLETAFEAEALEHFREIYTEEEERFVKEAIYALKKEIVRSNIINHGVRPDGRKLDEIRPIWCEVGILPRVHGSGVFTRGLTQVLTTLTLGSLKEAQELESIDDEVSKRYMHHYNMPPYSTGEARPLKAPGRREIGHGALAERALEPVLPSEEEFPYAIRTVSEILTSNGSTSQASVCGSTLALMNGGVPIKAPVAGIAMGLIKDPESGKVCVMSDIQGLEDFFGDMDFKVAGTKDGITAIQMDIKIKGIDKDILTTALAQAKKGREHILGKMLEVISEPNKELSKHAPKIITFNINPDKIREVIGTGGKVINKIIEETGVKIDIDDDGKVYILTADDEMSKRAKEIILNIAEDLEVGKKYVGKVNKIMEFGAFVEIAPGKDGMIHISKLSDKRVESVEEIVRLNDKVEVEVIKIDQKGRIDLKLVKIIL